ncbi:hypothetical protein T552_02935 [Pneumocystis carinii B80]|uniref:Vacuolar fusion protein MON1 n=1 Tax=Pneumocystis carinii (strain B80) TaxID=1408658 RepID=A0A0W4ZDJ1_PNEC8|nr:hypothetical protein T552_02935 [Pneumocystis carinii B80]KTW26456.1 hypothetical protein T552_02935 [Pneumocystis carinii B80]
MHNFNEASKSQKDKINVDPTEDISFLKNYDLNDLKVCNEDFKNKTSNMEIQKPKKHFFILSRAGKLIYSKYGDEIIISEYMGIIQTIINLFYKKEDNLKSFRSNNLTVVVLSEGPLYLVGISKLQESEIQIKAQLNILYTQIAIVLTLNKLLNIFNHKENFDLRRLLGNTEIFLDALSDMIVEGEPSVLLNGLQCLRLKKTVREKIDSILIKTRAKKLLCGIIASNLCIVSIIKPQNQLFLLFSMIFNTTSFKDETEHWIPLCFPKFDPKGFTYCYITFICDSTALILISTDKDAFFEMREMKQNIINDFKIHGILDIIKFAAETSYTTLDTNTPCIYHFIYKSKMDTQFTMPQWKTSEKNLQKKKMAHL